MGLCAALVNFAHVGAYAGQAYSRITFVVYPHGHVCYTSIIHGDINMMRRHDKKLAQICQVAYFTRQTMGERKYRARGV